MANTVLQLGNVIFAGMEIPEMIRVGGTQQLAVHRFVGGAREIDANGDDPEPLNWAGMFLGLSALDRARSIAAMRRAGVPVQLTWDTLRFNVLVRRFAFDYEAAFRISYSITCEVLDDYAGQPFTSDLDDAVNGDMQSANALSAQAGDSTLSSLTASLGSAVQSVTSFARASQSTIAGVLAPLNAARQQAQSLIASTEITIGNASSLGGLLPTNPVAQNVGKLATLLNTHLSATPLYEYNATLNRMATNLGQANSSVKTITAGGGNLFDLASKFYGKASSWTTLAQANKLKDPQLSGVTTLVIPPDNSTSDGIYTA